MRPEEKHGSKKRCHLAKRKHQPLPETFRMVTGLKEGGVPKKQMHPRLLNHHSGCFKWKEHL